jgi:dTDP-4-amino-4,6-dideoxygalactose transaminase
VGLHLVFHMYKTRHDWADGDEVITTGLTFVSTNHAIVQAGLTPVFADIDEALCLDPDSIAERITDKTRAVIFVGMGGNSGQYARVRELCSERGLKLILDAAHMSGTRVDGRQAGQDADCTVFSFQAVKNLATADSGMICFQDPEEDARARQLSWLGINKDTYARSQTKDAAYKWQYEVDELGFKYHGNSIMAAMALVSLRYLDRDNAYRRQLAAWYTEQLKDVPQVKMIPMAENCESSRHLFQIRVPNRDELMLALNAAQIYPGVHYRDNIEYKPYRYADGTCPKTRAASYELISLPMHMSVTELDVVRICQEITKQVTQ